ncbi:MAG TPA: DNA-3-methyladenine glycosylase [Streptosporangiaceae bacterium]|nr:DNA-3-methyladenine glycosylase [Streptosporangiaceae bacterium]
MERLPREFFGRPATEVAPDLLGCVLWHDSPEGLVAVRLVEVEAYQGSSDPASHAFRGQTARNAVMFGPPGHVYVYFTYGMHFCANLVCQPPGQAEAVLLRAAEVVAGEELAAERRIRENGRAPGNGRTLRVIDLARGPARLCQALGIDRGLDGADVCEPGSALGIGPGQRPADATPAPVPATTGPAAAGSAASGQAVIRTGPRVGVSQAADRPWRYWLAGDEHVSPYRQAKPRAPRQKPVTGFSAGDGTMLR